MPTAQAVFLAVGAASLFTFLTVTYWVSTRASERRTQERYALLRQVAERPAESARLVIDLLREEDARLEEKSRRNALKARHDSMFGGWILIAVGIGMAIMLASVADDSPNVWTVGLLPFLIGVVMIAYELATGQRAAAGPRAEGKGQR